MTDRRWRRRRLRSKVVPNAAEDFVWQLKICNWENELFRMILHDTETNLRGSTTEFQNESYSRFCYITNNGTHLKIRSAY